MKLLTIFQYRSNIANLLLTAILSALLATSATAKDVVSSSAGHLASHPNLVVSADDIAKMRIEVAQPSLFTTEYLRKKNILDQQLAQPIVVPIPKDAGGGYTHETHRNNSTFMYDAGIVYQVSGDLKYAHYVRDTLLKYADLYPKLPLHPERKTDSVISAGKLFWQNLNEAVWLVYTIQAYDAILPTLTGDEKNKIETGLFRPIVHFLAVDSKETFNKIHNHATWITCAVGMTGYVLHEKEWVETALLGSDKTGTGGFLRQLDELFSPQGYYNEGPYYQRYALLPFVTFAKAINVNEPNRKIFDYRDGILLKAINTTIQLSYNKLFFPINDVIKDKGIDTIELVNGVAIAYTLTGDHGLLSIAQQQNRIVLTGDGLNVAQALSQGLQTPYNFKSMAFGDGPKGNEGALVVMREKEQALVYKATAQGMGHGHFDKLNWLFFDKGEEIVSDYGAARFLNVEAKFGGRYLPENKTYANQTIAHNTLVVDEKSHFNGNTEIGNANHPDVLYFLQGNNVKISAALIKNAYEDTTFIRTMAQINSPKLDQPIVLDVLSVNSSKPHQYDLPVHYKGHLIDTNFVLSSETKDLKPLGDHAGYEYLWLKAHATPKEALAQITWLNQNGRFYTLSTLNTAPMKVLFTQIGANDTNFNLRNENAFILRVPSSKQYNFVSVLEPHGEYNPVNETTDLADSQLKYVVAGKEGKVEWVNLRFKNGLELLLAFNNEQPFNDKKVNKFIFERNSYEFKGRFKLFEIN